MSAEEWRPIPGFPGYFVTAEGEVGSTRKAPRSPHVRRIRWGYNTSGYPQVNLYPQPYQHFTRPVHVLVALAFLGPRPEGMQIRHLDGDKLNPRVENLRYGTASENQQDAVRHGSNAMVRKTHCAQGHPFDDSNGFVSGKQRRCRTCLREWDRQRRARLIAQRNSQVAA